MQDKTANKIKVVKKTTTVAQLVKQLNVAMRKKKSKDIRKILNTDQSVMLWINGNKANVDNKDQQSRLPNHLA